MPHNPHATFTVDSAVELAVIERSGFVESRPTVPRSVIRVAEVVGTDHRENQRIDLVTPGWEEDRKKSYTRDQGDSAFHPYKVRLIGTCPLERGRVPLTSHR